MSRATLDDRDLAVLDELIPDPARSLRLPDVGQLLHDVALRRWHGSVGVAARVPEDELTASGLAPQ